MTSKKDKNLKKRTNKEIKIEDNNAEIQNGSSAEEPVDNIGTEENDGKKLTAELKEAQEKIASLQDKYLRQVAEFDNYRKRILKEKSELILNGGEKVISSLLPVLDDFERALANIKKGGDEGALQEGVELIYQKFIKVLGTQGLKQIDTEKADFNTDYHEAIAMIPTENEELKGKVVDCVQQGYTLNNKVIRHAKVAVGQ